MCDLTYLLCFDEPNWNLSCSSSPLLLLGRVWSLQTLLDWPCMSFPSSFPSLASPDRILVNRWWWFSNSRCSCLWFCRIFTCCCCHLLSVLHLNCPLRSCVLLFWVVSGDPSGLCAACCSVFVLLLCCASFCDAVVQCPSWCWTSDWCSCGSHDGRKWCWCCCWMCWCLLCDGNLLFLWWCCFFFHGLLILDCIADVSSSSSSCVVMPLSAVCFGVDVALGKMKCGL